MIYIFIFLSKVIENALGTFRLIIVSNGKKIIGAILNAIISLIWIITTGLIVMKGFDIYKIFVFCFGCFLGSYLGSFLEEKFAFGTNMLLCITDDKKREQILLALKQNDFKATYTRAGDKNQIQNILFILLSRKKTQKALSIIKQYDENAFIISESANKIKEKNTLY